jgi:hypothetical protein
MNPAGFIPDPPGFIPDGGAPPKKGERYPHEWDPAALRRSQAAQSAVAASSMAADEENAPVKDRVAHALMGAAESIPGASLADEAAGAGAAFTAPLEALLGGHSPLLSVSDEVDAYKRGRDAQRGAQDEANADPLADLGRGLGTLAQAPIGIGTTVKTAAGKGIAAAAAQGAKGGALGGALQGLGDGVDTGDALRQALIDAGLGAVTGGALGAAGGAAGSKADVAVTNAVRRAAAGALSMAAKAAPVVGKTAGVVTGAVKGGPVGAYIGIKGGGKAGDVVAKAIEALAGKVRPAKPKAATLPPSKMPADVIAGDRSPSSLDTIASDIFAGKAPEGAASSAADSEQAAADMAESYDNWFTKKPATPEPRPSLDEAAKVLSTGTKVDRTPNPRTPAPKTPAEQRAAALDELDAAERRPTPTSKPKGNEKAPEARSAKQELAASKWDRAGSPEVPRPSARDRVAAPFADAPAQQSADPVAAFRAAKGDVIAIRQVMTALQDAGWSNVHIAAVMKAAGVQ